MHGRPRYPDEPEDEQAKATKAAKLRALQSQFLSYHQNKIFDKEAIEVSAKLLGINPELYTAWNYRKLAVDHLLSQPGSDPESIYAEELRLVESALRQNYKSYGAWHHRKWVLSKGHSSVDHELRLLDKFQKADARNFHAWNYRRFVADLKKISEEDELKYTTAMLGKTFSNYSAWHNRSVLLSNLLRTKAEGFVSKKKILSEEYEEVKNAIFTDPDDQSGWFYYLWLLEQTVANDSPFVISSWPATGSELILSANHPSGSIVLPLTSCLTSEGTLPVILCFNQAVRGVNSETVTVTSALVENKNLLWIPLSRNKDESAQAWVALLNLSHRQIDYSLDYTVEVSLGCSPGIISLTGCQLNHAFQSKFLFHFQQHVSPNVEVPKAEAISWEDSMFQKHEMEVVELDKIPGFNQLQIDKDPVVSSWQLEILNNEIKLFRDLDWCKIGKLTLARLLTALDTVDVNSSVLDSCHMAHTEEILSLYDDLMKNLDLSHSRYYREEYSLAKLRQVCCTKENLMKYCWHYSNSTQSMSAVCLRLNNLSLARIGSVEKLLWVQMLDLSHNELQSVEGLEALQLLSCLNLSHNKIRSFTALDPIRHLKSLKVLNVAYNEISEHSIDSTRYLCSSPLSHTAGSDWKLGVSATDHTRISKYWEAFFIFKDLNLIQLEVMGNAAALEEDFRCFLFRILPSLKWLDGKSL